MKQPNEEIAKFELEKWSNQKILNIKRFTTGNHHYVYDASSIDGSRIVIRMAIPSESESMAGALKWNKELQKIGIPLPEIYFANLNHEFPYIIMERLLGVDLGFVIDSLTSKEQKLLANQLINFQHKVGKLTSYQRYGYSVLPKSAPYASWSEVLISSLERSRKRILEIRIIDISYVEKVWVIFDKLKPELSNIVATPFLHDITTKNVILNNGKLSGIVDVDNLCYGDPLFHIALTKMALLSAEKNSTYTNYLLDYYGSYSTELLNLYTAICCVDFMSELGQYFNGNVIETTETRKRHLESILDSLLSELNHLTTNK